MPHRMGLWIAMQQQKGWPTAPRHPMDHRPVCLDIECLETFEHHSPTFEVQPLRPEMIQAGGASPSGNHRSARGKGIASKGGMVASPSSP